MDKEQLLEGIFKSGVVVERTVAVLMQDLELLLESLKNDLVISGKARFSRVDPIATCGFANVNRIQLAFSFGEDSKCRIIVDLVCGGVDRFSNLIRRPYLVWQIQSALNSENLDPSCKFLSIPTADSQEEGFTPEDWMACVRRDTEREPIRLFYCRDHNKYLLFYTELLKNSVNATFASEQDAISLIKKYIPKICSAHSVCVSEDFADIAISLSWVKEQKRFVLKGK